MNGLFPTQARWWVCKGFLSWQSNELNSENNFRGIMLSRQMISRSPDQNQKWDFVQPQSGLMFGGFEGPRKFAGCYSEGAESWTSKKQPILSAATFDPFGFSGSCVSPLKCLKTPYTLFLWFNSNGHCWAVVWPNILYYPSKPVSQFDWLDQAFPPSRYYNGSGRVGSGLVSMPLARRLNSGQRMALWFQICVLLFIQE